MTEQNISEKISNVITRLVKRPLDKLNVFIKISTGLFISKIWTIKMTNK